MIVISMLLVAVGFVALLLGVLNISIGDVEPLTFVYWAIAASLLAGLFLVIGVLRSRPRYRPDDAARRTASWSGASPQVTSGADAEDEPPPDEGAAPADEADAVADEPAAIGPDAERPAPPVSAPTEEPAPPAPPAPPTPTEEPAPPAEAADDAAARAEHAAAEHARGSEPDAGAPGPPDLPDPEPHSAPDATLFDVPGDAGRASASTAHGRTSPPARRGESTGGAPPWLRGVAGEAPSNATPDDAASEPAAREDASAPGAVESGPTGPDASPGSGARQADAPEPAADPKSAEEVEAALRGVSGVGPARVRALREHFGSHDALLAARVDDLAAVRGISRTMAERIHAALHR